MSSDDRWRSSLRQSALKFLRFRGFWFIGAAWCTAKQMFVGREQKSISERALHDRNDVLGIESSDQIFIDAQMLFTEKPSSELGLKAFSHPARVGEVSSVSKAFANTRQDVHVHARNALRSVENSNSARLSISICVCLHTMFMQCRSRHETSKTVQYQTIRFRLAYLEI